ncbi:MAG: chromate resistance protein, partial [Gammaproteobacteria bacterium]|nr:chromate resistance protein [Gammaproteobacteria bacterium]
VDRYVTFEVLALSFQLDADTALRRIGDLVHYLDVGGTPVAEAPGLLALFTGARESSADDDRFLERASELLDHLYTAFQQQTER